MFAPLGGGLETFRHLYVHVPFCRHKCGYCDFNAYSGMDRLMPAYVDALVSELEEARRLLPFGGLRTVYLGGGTPSLLPAGLAARLLAAVGDIFAVEPAAEVTLEANPASTDPEKLAAWRTGGVNRLSLGVQGYDPRALAVLERKTDGAQAVRAYGEARAAGFEDVNLDLIYAVPRQDRASWLDTLRRAAELGPEHLSCYCLGFEEGTLLHRRREQGTVSEVDADVAWDLLDVTSEELGRRGYERYEVSSWSRPGRASRHNRAYWDCRPVYGAGAGAHSHASDGERSWRWWNTARPREYIAACPVPGAGGEELGGRHRRAESLMLGLRTTAGLEAPPGFEAELDGLEAAGLVVRSGARVAPSRRGLDLHSQIALAVLEAPAASGA
ncbi:MAG: radical SAM family heme chaperone HemW [Candidatus Dormibacteraceae bacterium]